MSKPVPLFFGGVIGNKIVLDDEDLFQVYLASLEGQEVQVAVEKKEKRRSLKENNYYHGVVIAVLGEHWGDFPDVVHDRCKNKFLTYKDDKGFDRIKSTSELSTREFEEYCENIRMWASSEHNCFIPLPNEKVDWFG